ncbi:MAG: 5-formyltetrahydrofolate cyclo-ligase [Clostridia bacterium]|nr:5-formyltetrahydrofolate cyclo-ligase [Clostridia bacterium]
MNAHADSAASKPKQNTPKATGSASDLQMEKQALRRHLALLREKLLPQQASDWSEAIGRQLLASALLASMVSARDAQTIQNGIEHPGIGLFMAMRQEVDFQQVWQPLRTHGFRLCFPRMTRSEDRTDLEFLAIPDQEDPARHLVQSRFGVREPAPATSQNGLSPCDPAIILLPGLGFDLAGNRLGWGQGYYDHYLARRLAQNPVNHPILIGVAYPFQILDQIPSGTNDIPVDYLLSPAGLVKTRHNGR